MKNKKQKELEKEINKIWDESMMILANEDYVVSEIEELENCIKCFIGRAIKQECQRCSKIIDEMYKQKVSSKEHLLLEELKSKINKK